MDWCWIGLVTLAAVLQRSLSWNWRTRSPGQGIAAFSNVKRICASRVSSVSWFSTAAVAYWQETAAASVQQPVEEESRPGGKSGKAQWATLCSKARPLRARLSLPLLPTLGIEIRIRIKGRDQDPGEIKTNPLF